MEAGSLLPTGQSDTGKFPAAGKHYFTLENITSHWNTGAHVRDIGIQTHVPLHWNVGTHLHLTTLGHTDKTLLFYGHLAFLHELSLEPNCISFHMKMQDRHIQSHHTTTLASAAVLGAPLGDALLAVVRQDPKVRPRPIPLPYCIRLPSAHPLAAA